MVFFNIEIFFCFILIFQGIQGPISRKRERERCVYAAVLCDSSKFVGRSFSGNWELRNNTNDVLKVTLKVRKEVLND